MSHVLHLNSHCSQWTYIYLAAQHLNLLLRSGECLILWVMAESRIHRHPHPHHYRNRKCFPGATVVKYLPADAGDMRCGSVHGLGRSPGGRAWQPTPIFLPGESHGQRSVVGYSPWCCKELDTTEVTQHAPTRDFKWMSLELTMNGYNTGHEVLNSIGMINISNSRST